VPLVPAIDGSSQSWSVRTEIRPGRCWATGVLAGDVTPSLALLIIVLLATLWEVPGRIVVRTG
jgi:hypothetical protein